MAIRSPFLVVLLLIVIVLTLFFVYLETSDNELLSKHTTQLEPNQHLESPTKVLPRKVQQQQKNTQNTAKNKNTITQTNNISPWQRDSTTSLKAFPYDNPNKLHYEYISFNRSVIQKLKVGNDLPLFIPQTDQSFIGTVKNISTTKSGDTTYYGTLQDYDDVYEFIITQGEGNTYASIITPDGKFILEANGADAWIYNDHELRQKLDYSTSDAITIDYNKKN